MRPLAVAAGGATFFATPFAAPFATPVATPYGVAVWVNQARTYEAMINHRRDAGLRKQARIPTVVHYRDRR